MVAGVWVAHNNLLICCSEWWWWWLWWVVVVGGRGYFVLECVPCMCIYEYLLRARLLWALRVPVITCITIHTQPD